MPILLKQYKQWCIEMSTTQWQLCTACFSIKKLCFPAEYTCCNLMVHRVNSWYFIKQLLNWKQNFPWSTTWGLNSTYVNVMPWKGYRCNHCGIVPRVRSSVQRVGGKPSVRNTFCALRHIVMTHCQYLHRGPLNAGQMPVHGLSKRARYLPLLIQIGFKVWFWSGEVLIVAVEWLSCFSRS